MLNVPATNAELHKTFSYANLCLSQKMDVKDMSSSTFTDHRIIILTSWSHEKEPVLATNTEEDYIKWKEALAQSIRDVTAWKSACKRAMTIENPSRRKRLLTDHRKLYDTIEVTLSPEGKSIFGLYPPQLILPSVDYTGMRCS